MNYKFKLNKKILYSLFIFTLISLLSVFSASTLLNKRYIFFKQIIWYIFGYFIIFLITKIDIKKIFKHYILLYIIGNILLLLLLLVAPSINNSKSWFVIGPMSFQVSEFMKIILIITNSNIIYNHKNKSDITLILKLFLITLIPSILTFLEPDTGMVIIYLVISITTLFISLKDIRWFTLSILFASLLLSIFLSIYFNNSDLFIKLFGSNFFYRIDRLLDWKNGSGYQLTNALIGTGSSSLFGFGFNNTPIYFPEAQTDFIFSIITTNYGFIGSVILIITIIYFDINILNIAIKKNNKDSYIIIGILSVFIYSQIENISMNIGLLPIMGITLPFISYGGSSLISSMIMIGIILNIDKKKM